ncbi:sensor histidine kinase [Clostridium malenominatum]|uniref:Sensor histidine kinase n=1 Tax=Clostridium malenominatum TaxID=1539 RepID=A0ABN1J0R0_9CLOT
MKLFKRSNKFKDYISKMLFLYTIIIIAVIFLMFIASLYFNFKERIIKTNDIVNDNLSRIIEKEYDVYNNSMKNIDKDNYILKSFNDKSYLKETNRLLYKFSNERNIKSNFVLLDYKGNIITTSLYDENRMLLTNDNMLEGIMLSLRNNKKILYSNLNQIKFKHGQESPLLFGQVIKNSNIEGYLLFFLKGDSLDKWISNKNVDITIIMDKFDYIVYTNNNSIVNTMGKLSIENFKFKSDNIYFNEQLYYINSNKIRDGDLQIITMTSIDRYKDFLIIGIIFLLIITIIIIIVISLLLPKIIEKSLKPLNALNYAVSELKEGNLDYKIESNTFDEFEILFNEFNNMTKQIQFLIKNNNEISERKRIMEIKQLESQFNPHFVYNIMEMIRYEIIFDSKLASDLIVSFANLMRYNSNYGHIEVPINTDIEYIESYLTLQKRRFNERLEYNIEVDEDIVNYKLPKLILQPLIENSIKHGIENTKNLKINIIIKKVKDNIEVIVEDNGEGIKEDRLTYLKETLNKNDEVLDHIGIYNVQRVLKILYGDSYGINIESKYKQGTKIIFNIPIVGDDKNV